MDISTKYEPGTTESKWYAYWLNNGFFKSVPDQREPYCIVIPPPNVTGVLHMGHMLNNTIQDILIRRARMMGKNALWVPGTDHASIATEAKVVKKLEDEGVNKFELSREQFLEHAWAWTHKHGGIILEQLKRLGASCDWDRTCFTMDQPRYDSVIEVFIDLYNKGKIYRGHRMVNWDTKAKTAVSDEEVNYREEKSKLYYLKYFLADNTSEYITIATTRPETILGDTAVCVNPDDPRYHHLKGRRVYVPLIKRAIPIIEDSYVDIEFGTGCLKITPAHDANDYEIGQRHGLEMIDIFNEDGTLSQAAQLYTGLDRFAVRKLIVADLEKAGHLAKIEDYINKVGYSERTYVVIEPRLSKQWFLKMKEITRPALEAVMNGEIRLHPDKFKNIYRHWMENVRDWCISRQLWWGHRIPVYYINGSDEHVCARNLDEALEKARQLTGNQTLSSDMLTQDADALDTWFSSWLWPISVFNGILDPESADYKYYYPTNDLVTAPDILFFWVARMIMAGYEFAGKMPFSNVYLTGMVRDGKRQKMSKSLGNSPDALELIDRYGADGVRVGMLLCAPAGGDLLFEIVKDEATGQKHYPLPEQGRNFANKIWNAFRLVKGWKTDDTIPSPQYAALAVQWFESIMNHTITTLNMQFETYRLNEALMTVYKLFWDDFASWYLEIIKPRFGEPIDTATYEATLGFFDRLCRLLHPFVPFITEEVWQQLQNRQPGESIMVSPAPPASQYDEKLIAHMQAAMEVISNLRKIRLEKNIPLKTDIALIIVQSESYSPQFEPVIAKMTGVSSINYSAEKPADSIGFMVGTDEYFVPVGKLIDKEEELKKLNEELRYLEGFLESVMKKLSNERFVNNAPAQVVEAETKKKADAETKIRAIVEQIKVFSTR